MRHLVQILENLLSCHDCVVVPGLGGFLMNWTCARYDNISHRISPSCRQISFNARLTFNDGLLTQAYQQEDGLSYNEATHRINDAVAEIRKHLSDGESIQLGGVGSLRQTEDGRILFSSCSNSALDADSFGLESIACTPLKAVRAKDESNVDITLWKWAVSVAACFFLAVAMPTRQLPQSEKDIHHASVVSPITVAQYIGRQPELQTIVQENVSVEEAEQPEALAAMNAADVVVNAADADVNAADAVVNKPVTEKTYILVIASFTTREEAELYISRKNIGTAFPSIGIAKAGERYRVYAERYPTKQEAIGRLSSFRTSNPEYSRTWVSSF